MAKRVELNGVQKGMRPDSAFKSCEYLNGGWSCTVAIYLNQQGADFQGVHLWTHHLKPLPSRNVLDQTSSPLKPATAFRSATAVHLHARFAITLTGSIKI